MTVNMSGKLPAGDGNGLTAILTDLIHNPKKLHVAICIVDRRKMTSDADTGEQIPIARVRRIEVLTEADDLKVAERLMRRALDKRTGREALPYDLEEEMQSVFDTMTVEDPDDDPPAG